MVENGGCIETACLRDGNRFKGPVMFDGWTITCPLQNKSSLLQVAFSSLEMKGLVRVMYTHIQHGEGHFKSCYWWL